MQAWLPTLDVRSQTALMVEFLLYPLQLQHPFYFSAVHAKLYFCTGKDSLKSSGLLLSFLDFLRIISHSALLYSMCFISTANSECDGRDSCGCTLGYGLCFE